MNRSLTDDRIAAAIRAQERTIEVELLEAKLRRAVHDGLVLAGLANGFSHRRVNLRTLRAADLFLSRHGYRSFFSPDAGGCSPHVKRVKLPIAFEASSVGSGDSHFLQTKPLTPRVRRRANNRRTHLLGRFLALSHPEWRLQA